MIDQLKKYWIYLYPHVYVINKNNRLFLYNTQNAKAVETGSDMCLSMIKEIHEKHNLGVIELAEKYLNDSACLDFIGKIIEKNIGDIIEIEEGVNKPIVLLPILNLRRDIDRMAGKNDLLIGDNLLSYLSEINLYINGECQQNCSFCETYSSQTNFCRKWKDMEALKPDVIEKVLSQSQYSSLSNVNILGGNLLLYPYWDELKTILARYAYKYHLWIHYKNLLSLDTIIDDTTFKLNVLVNFPLNISLLEEVVQQYDNNENISYRFLIENEEEYSIIEDLISKYNLNGSSKIIPYFNGNNSDFFSDNVFIEKEDLFSAPIEQRKIFCNQKLNSNNFGKLYILPDGDVKANLNKSNIGNIHTELFLQMIYEELIQNTAWRDIRKSEPCSECFYQYLCPPPSNYEFVIGKANLCHIATD